MHQGFMRGRVLNREELLEPLKDTTRRGFVAVRGMWVRVPSRSWRRWWGGGERSGVVPSWWLGLCGAGSCSGVCVCVCVS